ncbi:MAG: DUF6456 domain-containing protein [Hyphomicrobiaceae bacterium]|nr:DUF6456 domain-containing protein [Hyphomicrobiaceae bacterium]
MPDAVSSEATLLPHMVRLARKGSYACPAGPADYAVYSPRNDYSTPIATLPAAAIEAALALGWLEAHEAQARLRLSAAGARCVRRHLSGARSRPARSESQPAAPRAPALPEGLHARARPQRVEGPLAWLRRRKDRDGRPMISEKQFHAGARLAADYARARLEARVTASWSLASPCLRAQRQGSAAADVSDMAMAARDRIHRAVTAVGPELASLLLDVCCHDIGLEAAEKARGWPARSGKVVLDMGLTQLARHYGLLREAAGPASARPRAWVDAGYTANLTRWL